MNPRRLANTVTLIACLVGAAAAASCGPSSNRANSNAEANANASTAPSADQPPAMPPDAKPAGFPGFYMAGPTGAVSLRFTYPKDDTLIEGDSVAPTVTITGYPIYMDAERNKGQHIHVILDNEPYEADYDPAKPFSPADGKFNNLSPGSHTMRAFPSREWHESIKEPDGSDFDMITFTVGPKATIT